MARKTADWIDSFEEFTEVGGSPRRLRRWAGIACLAGALERKVWVHTLGSNLYPNLYIFLTSPPGVGKSKVLNETRKFWEGLTDHRVAPSSVSKASLIDELADAHRTLIRPGQLPSTIEFHSLKIMSSELGVLLPEFANDFMNTLTDIYDGYPYGERRRTKNLQIAIPKPQINLLAGTTPSYLTHLLPEGAWDQGFLSRTIIIYDANKKLQSMFRATAEDSDLKKKLESDLAEIGNLYGELPFTKEAAELIDAWYLGGQKPMPAHPKLQHYNTRRPAHLLKLCQIASMSDSSEMEITLTHVQRAMDWLFDAELAVLDIFKAMSSGGDMKVMEECWHFLFDYEVQKKGGAPQSLLIQYLSRHVPSHNVERVIKLMEDGDMLRVVAEKGKGMVYYAKERANF